MTVNIFLAILNTSLWVCYRLLDITLNYKHDELSRTCRWSNTLTMQMNSSKDQHEWHTHYDSLVIYNFFTPFCKPIKWHLGHYRGYCICIISSSSILLALHNTKWASHHLCIVITCRSVQWVLRMRQARCMLLSWSSGICTLSQYDIIAMTNVDREWKIHKILAYRTSTRTVCINYYQFQTLYKGITLNCFLVNHNTT